MLVCGAVAAGGSQVVVTTSNTGHHPYLGLDWFILDPVSYTHLSLKAM